MEDKSHLKKPGRDKGWKPDAEPRFGNLLVEQWHAEGVAGHEEWRAKSTARFRHSDAGACARKVAYAALGVEGKGMDEPGHFITRLGSEIHEWVQQAIDDKYEGATEFETHVSAGPDMGGHEDANVELVSSDLTSLGTVSVEIKSLGGYGYKGAIGAQSGPAEGPSYSHVIQGSLNAHAREADELVIVYVARDAVSINVAKSNGISTMQRVTAEWTIDKETFTAIAEKEIERIQGILALVDDGQLPKRRVPDPELPFAHTIVDPKDGAWVVNDSEGNTIDAGRYWGCGYCDYQDVCVKTPGDRCSTDVLVQIGAHAERGSEG